MNRASKPVYTNIGVRGNGFLLLIMANYLIFLNFPIFSWLRLTTSPVLVSIIDSAMVDVEPIFANDIPYLPTSLSLSVAPINTMHAKTNTAPVIRPCMYDFIMNPLICISRNLRRETVNLGYLKTTISTLGV